MSQDQSKQSGPLALLFDLDGVLIDSEPVARQAGQELLAQYNKTLSAEEAHWMVGRSWEAIYEGVYAEKGLPLSRQQFTDMANRIYNRLLAETCPVLPGAKECIKTLAPLYRLAIVSGSDRQQIEVVLQLLKLGDNFELYLGNEDYKTSKPAPDGFLTAAKRLAVAPADCLAIEDSEAGVRAAKSAGMKVVAVQAGNFSGQDVSAADLQIETLTELTAARVEKLYRG